MSRSNNQQTTTNKNDNNKYIPPISPKGDSEVVSHLVDFAVKYGSMRDNGKLADTMQKFVSWGATVEEITDAVQLNGEWFNGRKSSLNNLVWAIHNRDTNALNAEELEAYNDWFTEDTEGM